MSISEYNKITRNITKITNEDYLLDKVSKNETTIYWGVSVDDVPTIRYIHSFLKIGDFLNSGCKVIVLLADLHAYLNSKKRKWSDIEIKTKYYKEILLKTMKVLNIDISNLFFVNGSQFQLSIDYTIKYFDLLNRVKIEDAKEAMNATDSDTMSKLVYSVLQLSDEYHLKVDAEFGDYKQEKIFELGCKLNKEKVNKISYLIGPYINDFSICLTDGEDIIRQKIKKINFKKDDVDNDLFRMVKHIIFLMNKSVEVKALYTNTIYYVNSYEEFEKLFLSKDISTNDIKTFVIKFLIDFLKTII